MENIGKVEEKGTRDYFSCTIVAKVEVMLKHLRRKMKAMSWDKRDITKLGDEINLI